MGNLKKMKDITKNVYWEKNTKMPMREIADYCEYIESEMANM